MGNCWSLRNDSLHENGLRVENHITEDRVSSPSHRTNKRPSICESPMNGDLLTNPTKKVSISNTKNQKKNFPFHSDLDVQEAIPKKFVTPKEINLKSCKSIPLINVFDDASKPSNLKIRQIHIKGGDAKSSDIVSTDKGQKDFVIGQHFRSLKNSPAKISAKGDGFYLIIDGEKQVSVPVSNIRYFLQKNLILNIGNRKNPQHQLRVASLNFPKLRVNFNGFRLKTLIKDNNWSTVYCINDSDDDSRPKIQLEDLQTKEIKDFTIEHNQAPKFVISGSPDAPICLKNKSSGFSGSIRYIDDTGWVVKVDHRKDADKENGVFINLSKLPEVTEFKMYEGLQFIINDTWLEVVTVEQQP